MEQAGASGACSPRGSGGRFRCSWALNGWGRDVPSGVPGSVGAGTCWVLVCGKKSLLSLGRFSQGLGGPGGYC